MVEYGLGQIFTKGYVPLLYATIIIVLNLMKMNTERVQTRVSYFLWFGFTRTFGHLRKVWSIQRLECRDDSEDDQESFERIDTSLVIHASACLQATKKEYAIKLRRCILLLLSQQWHNNCTKCWRLADEQTIPSDYWFVKLYIILKSHSIAVFTWFHLVSSVQIMNVDCRMSILPWLRIIFCSVSHRLPVVGFRPSSSLSKGCVVSLRGDWAIFCHAGSERVGRVWSAREKSIEILRRGWELNPGHREDKQLTIPLIYHDWHGFGLPFYKKIKVQPVDNGLVHSMEDPPLPSGWVTRNIGSLWVQSCNSCFTLSHVADILVKWNYPRAWSASYMSTLPMMATSLFVVFCHTPNYYYYYCLKMHAPGYKFLSSSEVSCMNTVSHRHCFNSHKIHRNVLWYNPYVNPSVHVYYLLGYSYEVLEVIIYGNPNNKKWICDRV